MQQRHILWTYFCSLKMEDYFKNSKHMLKAESWITFNRLLLLPNLRSVKYMEQPWTGKGNKCLMESNI
jgi:hypothetical protein